MYSSVMKMVLSTASQSCDFSCKNQVTIRFKDGIHYKAEIMEIECGLKIGHGNEQCEAHTEKCDTQ
jgi:hypothetical protein